MLFHQKCSARCLLDATDIVSTQDLLRHVRKTHSAIIQHQNSSDAPFSERTGGRVPQTLDVAFEIAMKLSRLGDSGVDNVNAHPAEFADHSGVIGVDLSGTKDVSQVESHLSDGSEEVYRLAEHVLHCHDCGIFAKAKTAGSRAIQQGSSYFQWGGLLLQHKNG
jgi:hypothetical protein